jgi:HPt (histidine-containing phosphotransfer) domain-containing protein
VNSSESSSDAQFQRELLRHYLKTADAKIASVANAIAQLRSQSGPERSAGISEAQRSLVVVLHTIAGNAGTYGFPELSRRARELERALIGEKSAGQIPAPLDQDLDRFLEEMRSAFVAAAATL